MHTLLHAAAQRYLPCPHQRYLSWGKNSPWESFGLWHVLEGLYPQRAEQGKYYRKGAHIHRIWYEMDTQPLSTRDRWHVWMSTNNPEISIRDKYPSRSRVVLLFCFLWGLLFEYKESYFIGGYLENVEKLIRKQNQTSIVPAISTFNNWLYFIPSYL